MARKGVDYRDGLAAPDRQGADYRQAVAEARSAHGVDWRAALASDHGRQGVDFREAVARPFGKRGVDWRAASVELGGEDLLLAADVGHFSLTGSAASVLHGRKITAGVGSYVLTGTSVNLTHPQIEAATFLSHRYWSVNVTAHTGATEVGIVELEFAKLGGADNTGGTATATDSFGSFTPDLAIDNNLTTQWIAANGGHPKRLQVDFGTAIDVNVVRLKGRQNTDPGSFTVDYSDNGSAWTTAWTCNGIDGSQQDPNLISFPNPTCTSGGKVLWRLSITDVQDQTSRPQLSEMELRDAVSGADKTISSNNIWDNGYFGDAPNQLFDNNTGTIWTGLTPRVGKVYYEFQGSCDVKELMLRASTATGQAPRDFTLAYSADGIAWTTALTKTSEPSWTTGETRTYTI